jgi:uncharacterized membrane protein YfcA
LDQWLLLMGVAVGAGALSGLVGTGASLLLLPVLVPMFGAVEAIPIMAVAGFMANFSRALAWWRSIAWKAVLAYALPGMPAAALGAYTLVHLPAGWPEAMLGLFIMALVPIRRLATAKVPTAGVSHLALTGAVVGFLTGVFLSTGPLSVPAFLAFGLVRGAFIATEATASLLVQAAKIVSFREFGAITGENMLRGIFIGGALMAGTFLIRPLVARLGDHHFRSMMDAVTLISGAWLLAFGLGHLL